MTFRPHIAIVIYMSISPRVWAHPCDDMRQALQDFQQPPRVAIEQSYVLADFIFRYQGDVSKSDEPQEVVAAVAAPIVLALNRDVVPRMMSAQGPIHRLQPMVLLPTNEGNIPPTTSLLLHASTILTQEHPPGGIYLVTPRVLVHVVALKVLTESFGSMGLPLEFVRYRPALMQALLVNPALLPEFDAFRSNGRSGLESHAMHLRLALASRDTMLISPLLVNIMRQHPEVTLDQFEILFRKLGIDIFLVAEPKELYPGYQSGTPGKSLLPFSVFIAATGGKEEAKQKLGSLGISEEQNLENLKQCGFLNVASLSNN